MIEIQRARNNRLKIADLRPISVSRLPTCDQSASQDCRLATNQRLKSADLRPISISRCRLATNQRLKIADLRPISISRLPTCDQSASQECRFAKPTKTKQKQPNFVLKRTFRYKRQLARPRCHSISCQSTAHEAIARN